MSVLDASAALAFLAGEPGADVVEAALDGAVIGAANWSEVMQKVVVSGANWPAARSWLESYGVSVEPVTRSDAERAVQLWESRPSLSLADRLCIALGERLGRVVLTAGSRWGTSDEIRQLR